VSGGDTSSPNFEVSYSIGQVSQISKSNSNGLLLQGVQQPFEIFEESTLDVNNIDNRVAIQLYPNPTKGSIHLSLSSIEKSATTYQLFDLQGRLLKDFKITTLKTEIDMQSYPVGTYLLKVLNSNQAFLKTFKIIKN
jgi:hypothetical protein